MSAFEPFGLQHWLSSSVTIGLAVLFPLIVRRLAGEGLQATLAKGLALLLAGYLLAAPAIRSGVFGFPLRENLPLHMCGASVVLGALMLWLRSFRVYEVVYFWGIGGALAALLDLDLDIIKTLLQETFAAKPKLVDSNLKAIMLGYDYAKENFTCPLPVRVASMRPFPGRDQARRTRSFPDSGSGLTREAVRR